MRASAMFPAPKKPIFFPLSTSSPGWAHYIQTEAVTSQALSGQGWEGYFDLAFAGDLIYFKFVYLCGGHSDGG